MYPSRTPEASIIHGWARERVLDLGGIAASRGPEMYLPLWLSLFGRQGVSGGGAAA